MPSSLIVPRSFRPEPSSASSIQDSYEEQDALIADASDGGERHSAVRGTERSTRSHRRSGDAALGRSQTHRHHGALKTKSDMYAAYSNKTQAPEPIDYQIKALQKKVDPQFRRTYSNGLALEEVVDSAPVLSVALKFLPGADKPQVNYIEQIDMEGQTADQKDAAWRVDTAGALLNNFTVSPDLQIVQTDQTAAIVARARFQAQENDRRFPEQRRALVLRKRYPDTVTIASERVTMVKDLRIGDYDLKGLLVEVDWSSLWDLMVNWRSLIASGGPEMTFEETRTLLETMIEDARRLCIRSPILFRMSTRVSIINSEDTRYGINNGGMFKTFTTSKGIKEIIFKSASYYNSLDPTGDDDSVQKFIRPRFLQMVVLLISLLNNEDLAEMKSFLEATYSMKADRRDIELMILRVIPLLSINPRVFLNALVPAIDNFPLEKGSVDIDDAHSNIWNIFVKRILADGYLLPAAGKHLGRKHLSWIVEWPEKGLKSTSIFDTLQYAGRLKTVNDIPPLEVNPGSGCTELTVVMTDESKYVIKPGSLDNIIFMTPGVYAMRETTGRKRCHDLVIQELRLNGELYEAIRMTNEIVKKVNQWLANPKRNGGMMSKIVRKRPDYELFLNDVTGTGRLVEVLASLKHTTLAITYKIDGRRISRFDAIDNIAREVRRLRAFISHIEHRGDVWMIDHGFFSPEKRALKQSLEQVKAQLDLAEQSRTKINLIEEVSNEPIVKCLYPEGATLGESTVWNPYKAWCLENNGYLQVEAKSAIIRDVNWLTGELIDLSLTGQPSRIFVTPLQAVPEGYRKDEVQVGETAVLLGRYIAIGEKDELIRHSDAALTMVNYLRIVSVEDQSQSWRRRNRTQAFDDSSVTSFK